MVAFDISVSFDTAAIKRRLDQMAAEVEAATYFALDEVADETWRRTIRLLSAKGHPRGTRTPSVAPDAPAFITRNLIRSLYRHPAVETGPGSWTSSVGSTSVYSRIQELGGNSGRHDRTHLPARPYLGRTVDELLAEGYYREQFVFYWSRAVSAAAR